MNHQRANGRRVDMVIIHCGGVSLPRVPVLSRSRFTFDARQVAEVCRLLGLGESTTFTP